MLTKFAFDLDKRKDTNGRIELDALSPGGKVSYYFRVNVTLVRTALSPGIFSATFGFEGFKYRFNKKRYSVDCLMVCPQLKPHIGPNEDMVYVHRVVPEMDLALYPEFEKEVKKKITLEWNGV